MFNNKTISKLGMALAALCLFVSTNAFSEAKKTTQVDTPFPYHHHISFGPQFLWYGQNKMIGDINSQGDLFLSGLQFTYTYLKPSSLFAEAILSSAGTDVDLKAYRNDKVLDWRKSGKIFGHLALNLGYSFPVNKQKTLISPFLGLGAYDLFGVNNEYNRQGLERNSFLYVGSGAHVKHFFSRNFYLGSKLNVFYAFEDARFNLPEEAIRQHDTLWGAEVALPMTWCFSDSRHWDFELEPFFLTLGFSKDQMAAGVKTLFTFNF